jgi:hypothetical protein
MKKHLNNLLDEVKELPEETSDRSTEDEIEFRRLIKATRPSKKSSEQFKKFLQASLDSLNKEAMKNGE